MTDARFPDLDEWVDGYPAPWVNLVASIVPKLPDDDSATLDVLSIVAGDYPASCVLSCFHIAEKHGITVQADIQSSTINYAIDDPETESWDVDSSEYYKQRVA